MDSNLFANILCQRGVRNKDISLLKLYAGEQNDPDSWKKLFLQIDFEHEPYPFNMALSRLGAKYGWDFFPNDLIPRLKGISLKENSKTVYLLSKCLRLFVLLNEKQIDFVVLKDSALKLFWLKDVVRRLTDVDILVSEGDFACFSSLAPECRVKIQKGVIEGLSSAGYEICGEGLLDVHCHIYRNNIPIKDNFEFQMEDSVAIQKGNTKLFVPNVENVYLQLLINGMDKLVSTTSPYFDLFYIFDLIDLQNRYQIKYEKLIELVKDYNLHTKYLISVKFLDYVLPGYFSREISCSDELGIKERAWNKWKSQVEHMFYWKQKEQNTGMLGGISQSLRYYYTIANVLYLVDCPQYSRPYFFLKMLIYKYVLKSIGDIIVFFMNYYRRI